MSVAFVPILAAVSSPGSVELMVTCDSLQQGLGVWSDMSERYNRA